VGEDKGELGMNENWAYIKENIERFPEYKSSIFEQGFLITNQNLTVRDAFPFFGNWRQEILSDSFHIWLHCRQKLYAMEKNGITYFLIGHAYDPFSNQADEIDILRTLAEQSQGSFELGLQTINNLTGLFVFGMIAGERMTFCGDFESMRTAYYGNIDGHFYLCSHEELVSLFEQLHRDDYVTKLEHYRWYHLYGEGLPGDISHYHELKKLICNNYVIYSDGKFKTVRIWPREPIHMCADEEEYRKTVHQIAETMKSNLGLIAQKWERPAVSVTGGRDSKGSLAASIHVKEKYQYFSYNSQPAEKVDCDAAEAICKAVGVPHITYEIPLDKSVYPEYDLVRAILCVNSNRRYFNHNDIMKRIYLRKANPFDVEVKSWTSEIGRAFYYKRYGVQQMQKKCTARRVNAMNNIFLMNPALMYATDARYREYLRSTAYNEHMFNYDWSDIIDLEMRDSRWGADVLSCEHMFSHDVTVPYNNRHLSDLMLMVPLADRIADRTHIDFTHELCPAIDATNISVRDVAHNNKRMWMDKIYYFITSIRPF
jgi:hypothetical protein